MNVIPPERYPCGKIKKTRNIQQIAEAERALQEAEMQVVLAQPHRQGNRSQLAESPFGRFCLEHKLRSELYDAGDAFAALKRKWRSAWGVPSPDRLGGSGSDVDMEDIKKWEKLLSEWESEMLREGTYPGRLSVLSLLFERPEPSVKIYPELAIRALYALAIYQGRLTEGGKS